MLKLTHLLFLLIIMSLLNACVGNSKKEVTRYYLIDSVDLTSNTLLTDKKLAIRINDIKMPQYLERFQIVTRSAENRLRFSEFNQWGEPLRKNLLRTLSQNLTTILATPDISTPYSPSATKSEYAINISIQQFEHDIDGHVKLSATWQIKQLDSKSINAMKQSNFKSSEQISGNNYDAIVNNMQKLYADFSVEIANAIYTDSQK